VSTSHCADLTTLLSGITREKNAI